MTPTIKKFRLKTNIQGVLEAANCSYCQEQTTTHCHVNKKGTGCYIDGKKVGRNIMCNLCVIEWDEIAESFRGLCKMCFGKECKETKDNSIY